MLNDGMIAIGFVIGLILICKLWNMYAMKLYKNTKKHILKLAYHISEENILLAGIGEDENGDYAVQQAIEKINFPKEMEI